MTTKKKYPLIKPVFVDPLVKVVCSKAEITEMCRCVLRRVSRAEPGVLHYIVFDYSIEADENKWK